MARKTAAATKDVQPDLLGGAAEPVKTAETATKVKAKAEPIAQPAVKKGDLVVVKNTPTNTLAVLVEAMSQKDANNLQIVAALHKEMVAEQARLDYIGAMRALKRELPVINKDGKIEFKDKGQGKATLRFASFENIHEIITPLIDKYGFDLWFSSEPGVAGMMNVIGHLEHENGYVRQTVLPMPHDGSGGKSGAQGWASAFSFGKRIATIGLLNIRTRAPEDRDVDGTRVKRTKGGSPQTIEGDVFVGATVQDQPEDDGIPKITIKQQDELVEALEAKGVSRKKFCEVYQLEKVADLPAERFTEVMQYVKSFTPKSK